jgi:hypothetical protein
VPSWVFRGERRSSISRVHRVASSLPHEREGRLDLRIFGCRKGEEVVIGSDLLQASLDEPV